MWLVWHLPPAKRGGALSRWTLFYNQEKRTASLGFSFASRGEVSSGAAPLSWVKERAEPERETAALLLSIQSVDPATQQQKSGK